MLEADLKEQACRLGFDLAGIAPATPADGFDRLQKWLAAGCAGEMAYMQRQAEARRHPASILADVRSVIMVGLSYGASSECGMRNEESWEYQLRTAECGTKSDTEESAPRSKALIARYARGADYHTVLWEKLDCLLAWLQERVPGIQGRSVVDTAPLLERDFARRAGLGWFGKNTMLINKERGSYVYLGALLVDAALQPDAPHLASHCGTCTACLDACPTQALTSPGWLDARRCISYLTIELRSPVSEELRPQIGPWIFGCDVCQEVCPWNAKHQRAGPEAVDPIELLGLTEEEFRRRFRGRAVLRTKRRGLLRNAAIVLGNIGDETALPALEEALGDPEPLIHEAASWAIDRIRGRIATGKTSLPTTPTPAGDFTVAKASATL